MSQDSILEYSVFGPAASDYQDKLTYQDAMNEMQLRDKEYRKQHPTYQGVGKGIPGKGMYSYKFFDDSGKHIATIIMAAYGI